MKTWLELPESTDFSIYNIPFGIGKYKGECSAYSRIGDYIIDLDKLQDGGLFLELDLPYGIFICQELNDFIGLGKEVTSQVRKLVQMYCMDQHFALKFNLTFDEVFLSQESVQMILPVKIGDYTDFYSSKEHAYNVGVMFRGKENALMPNWLHLPVAYHGRASSVFVSGTEIKRPCGQLPNPVTGIPDFGPTKELDIEVEMGFIIGKNTSPGDSVDVNEAMDYIFGYVLFNDWSARDIQRWEYVPLGPFLGKNFGSTISPWIIVSDALEAFKVDAPPQDLPVLPYLLEGDRYTFDISINADLQTNQGKSFRIAQTNYKYLYWTPAQQIAHHSVNGCVLNIGDLMASGTISGPEESSYGSLLELTWNKSKPLKLDNNFERIYLEDNDTVILSAYCEKDGIRIGFGEAVGKIKS